MATKKYYFAYKQAIPWNGTFSPTQFRKDWNAFVSNIDLKNPNLVTDKDVSLVFDVKTRNLTPDANFPQQIDFSVEGYVVDTPNEYGLFRSFTTGGVDIKNPVPGKKFRTIVAAASKTDIQQKKSPGESVSNSLSYLRESFVQTIRDQLSTRGFTIEKDIPLTDPDPALPGPPTQNISGVTNKAPVVDNPNVKLPTQEVKQLDATAAQQATSKAQSSVSNVTSQAQSAASNVTSQAQGAVSGVTSQAQGAVSGVTSQAQSAASNVTSQAQGSVSGVTNQAQSAGSALNGLTGGLLGGAAGAGIGALAGGGKGALIGGLSGAALGGVVGSLKSKTDGLGKDWNPDKFNPSSIAGNDKVIDPKTGQISSTQAIAKADAAKKALGAGLLGGAAGAGIGALAGGGRGALIGGLGGAAVGTGLSIGGVTGGALAGTGLGAGIGALAGGSKGAIIGGLSGGALGAAAAKLASIKKGVPKPKVPKPPSQPRIKTIKVKKPKNYTGDINVPTSAELQKEAMSLPDIGSQQISNINQNLSGLV